MELKDIGNPTYIALRTFRKNGEGVSTPVWVTAEDDKLYVWTGGTSGKVKRIRNNPRVQIAVSDARGNITGDWVDAQATIIKDAAGVEQQRQRVLNKYGMQFRLISLMSKLRRSQDTPVAIELRQP